MLNPDYDRIAQYPSLYLFCYKLLTAETCLLYIGALLWKSIICPFLDRLLAVGRDKADMLDDSLNPGLKPLCLNRLQSDVAGEICATESHIGP